MINTHSGFGLNPNVNGHSLGRVADHRLNKLLSQQLANLTRATLAPGLPRKLKKVLECGTDSPDVLASFNTPSSFYSENTPQSRRNLRFTIEKRGLVTNLKFLEASLAAQEALDCAENEFGALATSCDKIAVALSSCTATTERLKQELDVTTQRQQIVSCFLRYYQLSNQEISALREEELNDNFFKAFSHVQEIHANCKLLLRTQHQRAGLELMDMMAV